MAKKVITILISATFALTFVLIMLLAIFPCKYREKINAECYEKGLNPALVASIIFCESRFSKTAVSSKGAMGLMQLMPQTAKSFYDGGDFNEDLLYNPQKNIEIGTNYLKYLFNKYDDEIMVLASYNAGEGVANRWLKNGKLSLENIEYKETKEYIMKVLKMKRYYSLFYN